MQVSTSSGPFSINWSDFLKGLIIAVLTPVLTIAIQSLEAGVLTFDWPKITATAKAALLAYLVKNFFTPAQIVIHDATKETVQAVKEGDTSVTVGGTTAKPVS